MFTRRGPWLEGTLGRGLIGRKPDSGGMPGFVKDHYQPNAIAWLGDYEGTWDQAMIHLRTADHPLERPRWVHDYLGGVPGGTLAYPGLPWFYPLALLGMLAAMLAPGPARRVHLAWVPVMLGVWALATLVGVTNARYRFAYEPFCWIYLCLLLDCLAGAVVYFVRRPAALAVPLASAGEAVFANL